MANWLVVILSVENHPKRGSYISIECFIRKMHNMHLKIESLPIYCVLWFLVEMELIGVKLKIWKKIILHVHRLKILCFWLNTSSFYQKFYGVVRIPSNISLLNVYISLLKFIRLIYCGEWIAILRGSQVDWTLLVLCTRGKYRRPVITIFSKVPRLAYGTPRKM